MEGVINIYVTIEAIPTTSSRKREPQLSASGDHPSAIYNSIKHDFEYVIALDLVFLLTSWQIQLLHLKLRYHDEMITVNGIFTTINFQLSTCIAQQSDV